MWGRERLRRRVGANRQGAEEVDHLLSGSAARVLVVDSDFVLDRHSSLVIVSPCSGHGAGFAPPIGAMAADLATGRAEPLPRFRLDRAAWAVTETRP